MTEYLSAPSPPSKVTLGQVGEDQIKVLRFVHELIIKYPNTSLFTQQKIQPNLVLGTTVAMISMLIRVQFSPYL